MILETFAKYLKEADPILPATSILTRWLWERLTFPAENLADRILRCEIEIELLKTPMVRSYQQQLKLKTAVSGYVFRANSDTGKRLLRSLYEYSMSYEQQKWSRWVHHVKASDFNHLYRQD